MTGSKSVVMKKHPKIVIIPVEEILGKSWCEYSKPTFLNKQCARNNFSVGRKKKAEARNNLSDVRKTVDVHESLRKKQREQEREAARLALQQIGKTVEFDDNIQTMNDFLMLIHCPLSGQYGSFDGRHRRWDEFEEGEICK